MKNDMLTNGTVVKATNRLEYEDRREMSSIISYLVEWHGIESFSPWLPDSAIASLDTLDRYSMREKIAGFMGFNYVSRWSRTDTYEYFGLNARRNISLNISDYDYMVNIALSSSPNYNQFAALGDDSCFIHLDNESSTLEIRPKSSSGQITLSLSGMLSNLTNNDFYRHDIPVDEMTLTDSEPDFKVKAVFSSITGIYKEDKTFEIKSIEGLLLIRYF